MQLQMSQPDTFKTASPDAIHAATQVCRPNVKSNIVAVSYPDNLYEGLGGTVVWRWICQEEADEMLRVLTGRCSPGRHPPQDAFSGQWAGRMMPIFPIFASHQYGAAHCVAALGCCVFREHNPIAEGERKHVMYGEGRGQCGDGGEG